MNTISVILPVYNAQDTIGEAIQSIINQTYTDWELLVINDGSTDNTRSVILSFDDPRIKYIENDGNKQLIYSLNRGLELASGKYIARMDADDISLPERFACQVRYMDSHPEIIVCGTYMQKFGNRVVPDIISFYSNNDDIKNNILTFPPFGHPSVMIRKSVLDKTGIKYDYNYKCAEDLKLWIDLLPYGNYANIPQVLLRYRISDFQCTQNSNMTMINNVRKCRKLYFKTLVSADIWDEYITNDVSVGLLKKAKKHDVKRNVIQVLYQSMKQFNVYVLFYYFFSFDFLKDSPRNRNNTLRRFMNRGISLL